MTFYGSRNISGIKPITCFWGTLDSRRCCCIRCYARCCDRRLSCHHVTAFLCVCVCLCKQENNAAVRENSLKTRFMYLGMYYMCLNTSSSRRLFVCVLSASSASSIWMSHDQPVMFTKERLQVICSVSCSAPLNNSRRGKNGWGLPFSLPSSSSPSRLQYFVYRTRRGWRMKSPHASPPSACHCVIHLPLGL